MIVCHVCGTENPDNAKYCEGCGVELNSPADLHTSPVATPTPSPANGQAQPAPAMSPEILSPPAMSPAPMSPEAMPPLEEASALVETPVVLEPGHGMDAQAEPPTPPAPIMADTTAPEPALVAPTPDPVVEPPLSPLPEAQPSPVLEPPLGLAPEAPTPAPVPPAEPMAPMPLTVPPPLEPTAPVSSAAVSSAPADAARLMPKVQGALTGQSIDLKGDRLSVGRFDPSTGPVDLDLSELPGNQHVSRRHAELHLENGRWVVRDLGSTNGVYVKRPGEAGFGARLQSPYTLQDGDEIAFGNVLFIYRDGPTGSAQA